MRVEDTDRTRYQEGSLSEMMDSLRWMGMQWDEGPDVGGDYGPYFQSERLELYHKYAQQLVEEGKAYYCYCTKERLDDLRKTQEKSKQAVGYDRRCRTLTDEEREACKTENPTPVIRFGMKHEGETVLHDSVRGEVVFQNELQDDFIIIKADGFPTYHFASIVDDHLMEITHVIRGDEWISSAPKHLQLYEALGWDPPEFIHPSLIRDENGKKLSKRSDTQTRFFSYIEDGYLPEAMLNFLATMGWSSGEDRKLFSREELIEKFSFSGITKHPAIFDLPKLDDLNGEYIRMADIDRLTELALPRLQEAGYISREASGEDIAYLKSIMSIIFDRIVKMSDVVEHTDFFYKDELEYEEKGLRKHLAKDGAKEVLASVCAELKKADEWNVESIEAAVRTGGANAGAEGGKVIHPVRMSVTGRTWGPGLFELMEVLGKNKCTERINKAAHTDWQSRVEG